MWSVRRGCEGDVGSKLGVLPCGFSFVVCFSPLGSLGWGRLCAPFPPGLGSPCAPPSFPPSGFGVAGVRPPLVLAPWGRSQYSCSDDDVFSSFSLVALVAQGLLNPKSFVLLSSCKKQPLWSLLGFAQATHRPYKY